MRITQLVLPVSDVSATTAYFRDVMQLPVDAGRVRVGWSTLVPVPADDAAVGGVHLAFNVADNRFSAAMTWLRARTPLQHDADGRDHFALESRWQSQSVYFTGPDGLVLELIGRRRLPRSSRTGAFDGRELTCLSEVGLPSDDVDAARGAVTARFGLQPLSPPSDVFAPMGDDDGLLILVDARRRWFPQQRTLPCGRGLQVRIQAATAGALLVDGDQGWQVHAE